MERETGSTPENRIATSVAFEVDRELDKMLEEIGGVGEEKNTQVIQDGRFDVPDEGEYNLNFYRQPGNRADTPARQIEMSLAGPKLQGRFEMRDNRLVKCRGTLTHPDGQKVYVNWMAGTPDSGSGSQEPVELTQALWNKGRDGVREILDQQESEYRRDSRSAV